MAYPNFLDKVKQLIGGVPQGLNQIGKSVGQSIQNTPQYKGAQMYQQAFKSPPVQQAIQRVSQQPIYNIPNSPTYGQVGNIAKNYATNRVIKPIVQASFDYNNPKSTNLQKGMAFAQAGMGVFNATPGGLGYNAVVQGGAGALEAFRNKTNLSKGYAKGLTNQTSLGSQGLGIKNPILAGAVDVVAGLRSFDPYRSGSIGVAALGANVKTSNRYNAPLQDALRSVRKNPDIMNPSWNKMLEFAKRELTPKELAKYQRTSSRGKLGFLNRIEQRFGNELKALHKEQGIAYSDMKLPSKQLPKELEGLKTQVTPKTVNVWRKNRFSEGGGYVDVPVLRKEENITLYQGGKMGDNRQFWTSDKKYAAQFGNVKEKTGTFYKVDNGNRVTDVYVEAPSKSTGLEGLAGEARKYKSAEEFVTSQPTYYHQSQSKQITGELLQKGDVGYKANKDFSAAKEGIYFSTDKEGVVSKYGKSGGALVEAKLVPKKPLDLGDYDGMYFDGRKANVADIAIENTGRAFRGEPPLPMPDITLHSISAKAKNWLQKNGYDLVNGKISTTGAPETVVIDKSIIKTKSQLTDIFNQAKGVQSADLSFKLPKVKAPQTQKLSQGSSPQGGQTQQPPAGGVPTLKIKSSSGKSVPQKPRGFTTSVQEAPNVKVDVKQNVNETYVPKPNTKLMGEAEALLHEGAKLDFNKIQNADQKVLATIQQAINNQRKNPEQAANLFNNLSEQGTELGRGVQAFALLKKMTPESIALSAAGKIKKYNMTATRKIPELTGDQVKLIAKRVDALNKLKVGSREHNIAVNELSNTINQFIPSSLTDKAITVWKAGLLTSLRTHERNLLGNTIMGSAEVAKDVFASPLDMLMSMKTGKRTLTLNVKGQGTGMKKGLVAAKDIIQKGYDPEQTIAKFDQRRITWGNNPLEQALKKGTDVVFRSLGGEDKPFLHGATARSLFDQAKTEAINVGRKGDTKLIEKLVANPTEEMIKIAQIDANYATFHDKTMLGTIANGIKRVASDSTYGKWGRFGQAVTEILAPFTGVPSSIVGKTIDYSPIGLAKGTVNVGRVLTGHVPELQRQAAQEMGRGILGTGIFGLGAYLMSKGLMTGQPKDTKEADQWQIEGKQANSVLVDGKWRSINSIGPQNLVMLAGAKWQEERNKVEGSMGNYAAALAKDQLSQTFLQGVQGPLNAISDPQRFAKSYVGNQLASVIPNIIKDIAKSGDSSQRESNSVTDYIKNSLPGIRNQSTPKRDVIGNELPQEPTGVGAFIDLFNSKTPIKNSVVDELSRLNTQGFNATPSKLQKTQTIQGEKTVLTPEQLDSLEKFRGPVLSKALDELFLKPSYQSMSDQDKANAVDSVVLKVNKYMRGEGGSPTFNLGATTSKTLTIEEPKAKTIKVKTPKVSKAKVSKGRKAKKGKKISIAKIKVSAPKRINIKMKVPKMPKIKKMSKNQLTFKSKGRTLRVKV